MLDVGPVLSFAIIVHKVEESTVPETQGDRWWLQVWGSRPERSGS
jgi:hypothetical protein